ncbi:MAG: YjfI family protein [Pseudomonadales bacterium]|nr:YjfI family protein [Pseudomonadales bacterium]
MNTRDLALRISDLSSFEGYQFDCQPIPGETEVLQITLLEFEELPAFISVTDSQILCITYLFGEDEVNQASRGEMLEEMLELNIPMPLSSFAKLGDRYVVFGALSMQSSMEDICHEVVTLTENAVEAIEALEEFLV